MSNLREFIMALNFYSHETPYGMASASRIEPADPSLSMEITSYVVTCAVVLDFYLGNVDFQSQNSFISRGNNQVFT